MNKSLIMVIAVISISISAQIGFAAPTISVEPSYQSVSHGATVTVNITVDPDGNTTAGVEYILCFNNTLLNATSLVPGAFFSGFDIDTHGDRINNTAGTVDYCELIKAPITGGVITPGTFTTITFQAIGEHGISDLYFKKVTLSDPDGYKIPDVANNGRVGIAQPSTPFLIHGYVSYKDDSECNNPAVNITNLDIGEAWTAERIETSNYYQFMLASCDDVIAGETLRFNAISPDGSMSNTTEHNVTMDDIHIGGFFVNITLDRACGDVDNNAIVNILDVRLLLNYMTNGYPIDDEWAGDVDGSGTIDMTDVQLLLDHVFKT